MSQGLRELLQSIADVMFPSDPGAVVQIDSIGYDGDTPLHVMAWQDNLEAVQVLHARVLEDEVVSHELNR